MWLALSVIVRVEPHVFGGEINRPEASRGAAFFEDQHDARVAVGGEGGYVEVASLTEADENALAGWLADESVVKAAHDLKLPLRALRARGWKLRGVSSDTALAAYLVRPGQRSFALDDLALRYLKRELRAEEPDDGQLSLLADESEERQKTAQAAIVRAFAVAELADALDAELVATGQESLLATLELSIAIRALLAGTATITLDPDRPAEREVAPVGGWAHVPVLLA